MTIARRSLPATSLALLALNMATGQLVINEIMYHPSAVSDKRGEWIELFNAGDTEVDINGWVIKDDDYDHHRINNDEPLVISPGGYLVLGNNEDISANGGVELDYCYHEHFVLNNREDEIVLMDMDGTTEVDRVVWKTDEDNEDIFSSRERFPYTAGAAWALRDPSLDNNVVGHWCVASTSYGKGDKGTPGAANDCTDKRHLAEVGRGLRGHR